MMTTRELQDEIIRLKKEKDVCILAHAYQNHEILEVADYMGDSFGLSQQAAEAPQKTVIMCGVRFMAETVKILSPDKKVILSNSGAGCPMAEQLSVEELAKLKEEYPDHTVVAYINTTSELKTLCDVCVTSASAVSIVNNIMEYEHALDEAFRWEDEVIVNEVRDIANSKYPDKTDAFDLLYSKLKS